MGRGGGARCKAEVFCPSKLGSNPGMVFAWLFGSELLCNLYMLGVGFFSKE